ncbi:MAG: murein biosynthesis integral membrane protein MurJ [Pseudomonadota bacterium]
MSPATSRTSQRESDRSLLRRTGIVGTMTLLSRFLGLARDILFTRLFGADWMMDAFIIANRIPNMLRRFFAEGALSQAFVPVLGEVREHEGDEAVRRLSARVAGTLGALLFALSVAGIVFAPLIVLMFAPGFARDEDTFSLASLMLRFTFPYILFISLTSVCAGLLNTYDRYAIPAVTPVLLNVVLIGFAIFVSPQFERPTLALALGVFAGGVTQLAFQLPFLIRAGLLSRPRWGWRDSKVQKILTLMLPAILGSSVAQINLIVDNIFATLLGEARTTWLYYSDRLMEFPLGVFGIALATVVLPSLTRSFSRNDTDAFSATLDWSLRLVFLLALPATIGLALLAGPLVTTLFFGGAFTAFDVQMARASLWAFSGGLTAFITIKILAPGYFARQDTKTPVKAALVAMVVNFLGNLAFVALLTRWEVAATHAGLAFSMTLSAVVNAGLLWIGLRRQGIVSVRPGWRPFLFRLLLANAALATFLLLGSPALDWWLAAELAQRLLRLGLLVVGGVFAYFVSLAIVGLRPHHLRLQSLTGSTGS